MPECPQFGCRGGQIEDGDGDGQAWHRTCETCGGTGEVSEEWMEEYRSKQEQDRRDFEAAYAAGVARRQYIATHTFCAHDGAERNTGFIASLTTNWFKCSRCGKSLCEKHIPKNVKRAPFFSLARFMCPYCNCPDGKMYFD